MNSTLRELVISTLLTIVLIVVLCGAYPVAVWAAGQLCFRDQANGSLIVDGTGGIRGSRLLAQNFTGAGYFHPRPSAAGNGYDAANSSGTNLGPTSKKLADAITAAVAAYRLENGLPEGTPVPADAVTSSASGLDPQISPANAAAQSARVAAARHLPLADVRRLVAQATQDRDFGVFGEAGVNVLQLNLALDGRSNPSSPASGR